MPISPATQALLDKAVADSEAATAADTKHNADVAAVAAAMTAEQVSHAEDLTAHQVSMASFLVAVNALAIDLGEPPPFPNAPVPTPTPAVP